MRSLIVALFLESFLLNKFQLALNEVTGSIGKDPDDKIEDSKAWFHGSFCLLELWQEQTTLKEKSLAKALKAKNPKDALRHQKAALEHASVASRNLEISTYYANLGFSGIIPLGKTVENFAENDFYKSAIIECLTMLRAEIKDFAYINNTLDNALASAFGIRQQAYVHIMRGFVYKLQAFEMSHDKICDNKKEAAAAKAHFNLAVSLLALAPKVE